MENQKKNRILCVKNSFHGRTLAAIYASGSKKMTEGFGPKVDGFDHFEFGNRQSLKKAITKKPAAIKIQDSSLLQHSHFSSLTS